MFGGNYLFLENLASDSINFMPDVCLSQHLHGCFEGHGMLNRELIKAVRAL